MQNIPESIEIWISEKGNFSAYPVPADSLKDWTEKLSRFASFDTVRDELQREYGIAVPAREEIDFRPTLFGMQKAVIHLVTEV